MVEVVVRNEWIKEDLVQRLIGEAIAGLVRMFDKDRQLFCFRVRKTEQGIQTDGISLRYTIISLIGLRRIEEMGEKSPIDLQRALTTILQAKEKIQGTGDIGLLIWLCAQILPTEATTLFLSKTMEGILAKLEKSTTMELAWLLSGLTHLAFTGDGRLPGLQDATDRTFQYLMKHYGHRGIFGHGSENLLAEVIRGRIGSFADQVYPIYALAQYDKYYGVPEARYVAKECAEALCRSQGNLGQWWWHYDSKTGDVVGRYPVYSVHQDGMAPMALFAAQEVTGQDYRDSISKGLRWVAGDNEIGLDLISPTDHMIWRSLRRPKMRLRLEEILSRFHRKHVAVPPDDLTVLYECRPYHLGWLLYALAGRGKEVF